MPVFGSAGARDARHFELDEELVREVSTPARSQACSPHNVLPDLFRQIAPVAHIYPTENYYYFHFYEGGKSYSGSLRLAADSRDKGIVQFACYESYTSWLDIDERSLNAQELSREDGVFVSKVDNFDYDVTYRGVTVRFVLNRLDQTPDPRILANGEEFVGRCFDESGLIFDLIYDRIRKAFYFVLDTNFRVSESFVLVHEHVYLGKRTGFVFFEDTKPHRFILIAANAEEIYRNTPYDGPFDQLPENFYSEIHFWERVFDAFPDLKGKVTPGGSFIDSKMIFAIAPYKEYETESDLRFIDKCLHARLAHAGLVQCLAY